MVHPQQLLWKAQEQALPGGGGGVHVIESSHSTMHTKHAHRNQASTYKAWQQALQADASTAAHARCWCSHDVGVGLLTKDATRYEPLDVLAMTHGRLDITCFNEHYIAKPHRQHAVMRRHPRRQ